MENKNQNNPNPKKIGTGLGLGLGTMTKDKTMEANKETLSQLAWKGMVAMEIKLAVEDRAIPSNLPHVDLTNRSSLYSLEEK